MTFHVPMPLSELFVPVFEAGMLFTGLVLAGYIALRDRVPLFRAIFFMGLFGLVFVGSEASILIFGSSMRNIPVGMQFQRLEQLGGTMFLFSMPYYVSTLLIMSPKINRINRIIAFIGLGIAIIIAAVAFISPDLFISQTVHNPNYLIEEASYARGKEGIVYVLRDLLLGLAILYTIGSILVDMVWHSRIRGLILPFAGILIAVISALNDILNIYIGYNFVFPELRFSRFCTGMSFFILLSMANMIHQYINKGKEVILAREEARREAERNREQNDFIKNVLRNNTTSILKSTSAMSNAIEVFSDNSRTQAASTEEVAASIEEITAGATQVSSGAETQEMSMQSLGSTLETLAGLVKETGEAVRNALRITSQVTANAKSGEQSMRVMNDSMHRIGQSSEQMNGIIQIINDISDRINLLSLNAAIEAARAGDAGRGFAVVADEISKLADATASSIKEIDSLIKKNDQEIGSGTSNIEAAVKSVNEVIRDVDQISVSIERISELMNRQSGANETVLKNAEQVRERSHEIMAAMVEQKNATEELSNTVNGINIITQQNTLMVTEMAESSKELVEMVEGLNREIVEHRDA